MDVVLELGKEVNGMDLFQLNWIKLQCSKGGLLNGVCYILANKDLNSSVSEGLMTTMTKAQSLTGFDVRRRLTEGKSFTSLRVNLPFTP